jgi:hypothetical protein
LINRGITTNDYEMPYGMIRENRRMVLEAAGG